MSQSDFVSRGQALVTSGQFQEAVKVCRLGLLGRPTTVEGRIVLGQALFALKRYDEVLAEMRVALDLDHSSVGAQTLKAEAQLRKGDPQAAIETLQKARQLAPTDQRLTELLAEAQRATGSPPVSTSHPAVGYVGRESNVGPGESPTRHYPNQPHGEDDTGDNYTRPTSIAQPSSRNRAERQEHVPPESVLAVGDRSGTVEVDPELDGVEIAEQDDLDDIAAPPIAAKAAKIGGARGSVKSSRKADAVDAKKPKKSKKTPTVALDDDDLMDGHETGMADLRSRKPGPGTAVRNAVARPSGPLDQDDPPPQPPRAALPPPARSKAASAQPFAPMPPAPMPPAPMPPAPMPPAQPLPPPPRIAAAMPTMAAVPPQPLPPAPLPYGISPASAAAAARPTIALNAAQQQSAAAVDQMFGTEQAPNWARATVLGVAPADPLKGEGGMRSTAAASEPTARPGPIDPRIQDMFAPPAPIEAAPGHPTSTPPHGREMRTGVRKLRSPLRIVMWIVTSVLVIGGGVFAGFQFRRMRLDKQILAARNRATDVAKADTWTKWIQARDSLAGIVQASGTDANRAALARARALIAFEFGDGVAEAKTAVDGLAGQGGSDAKVAAAYLALAQNDVKAAKLAADAALGSAGNDATVQYVAGQAALLAGDAKSAVSHLRKAVELEPRPLHGVGLARALAATYAWDDALATLDQAVPKGTENPAVVITRAVVLAASGRIAPGSPAGTEIRAQLDKMVAEGSKPAADQNPGVSPAQVAFGNLALAQVDFARGELNSARGDVRAAAAVMLDDQRFAEEAVETLFLLGDLDRARAFTDKALNNWPTSRRARIAQAQIALAQGKGSDAIEILEKQADVMDLPKALTVRGQAALAMGDLDNARKDFDAALKKVPSFEPAIVGLVWVDIAEHDLDNAKKLVDAHYKAATASAAITTAYAAVLRASGDPAARDTAKQLLEKLVGGPPGLDVARAQLELARIDRDLGDYKAARAAYADAGRAGNVDARLENALLLIDDADPAGGRDTLDLLLKEIGEHPSTQLLLEVARARMLVGDNVGAAQQLEIVAKAPGALAWKLDRERGRLALHKNDFAGASSALARALEGCADDSETFLLAADAATADDTQAALIDKIKKLAPERLKGQPEASIVNGKLLLAAKKDNEAEQAFLVAKKALETAKASKRRQAQAHLGLAVVAYNRSDDPTAKDQLALVFEYDPSLYNAYLFAAEIMKDKDPKRALSYAERATTLDPDNLDGWVSLGQIASKLGDRKTLADAIGRLSSIAPDSEQLKTLQTLKR